MTEHDTRYMALALSLGRRGMGNAWPNPAVGCVIVQDNRIVGRGWTQPGGRPHAERVALDQAGVAAKGATAYVTLEPCAHHGQTPPCADALIEAGVARVVIAEEDSDPRVSGQGIERLRAAGINLTTRVLVDEAAADLSGFLQRVEHGRPRLTLKLATSFDGRIATAVGHSQWITGPEARRYVHGLRARHDGVMVGAGTARSDDPTLNVRDMGVTRQPVRIVVSRRLDLPLMSQLARTANDIPLWLCHGPDVDRALIDAWTGIGAELIPCALKARHLDISGVLKSLGDRGLTSVFCEGGGALGASLLASDLVDELIGFTAGLAIGADGLPSIGALGLEKIDEGPRLHLAETRPIGRDVLHRWMREP